MGMFESEGFFFCEDGISEEDRSMGKTNQILSDIPVLMKVRSDLSPLSLDVGESFLSEPLGRAKIGDEGGVLSDCFSLFDKRIPEADEGMPREVEAIVIEEEFICGNECFGKGTIACDADWRGG